ncbi:hypothetical protein [Curtobacterium sp. 24E2]|nr:hypothetical protein JN350_07430 [Curtobacterium sp. 24E2]
MPELASPDVHRALHYLAALNRAGYHPSARELDAYAEQPDRSSRTIGGISQTLMQSGNLGKTFSNIFGRSETETYSDHFVRLAWALKHSSGLIVTAVGRAALDALDTESSATDSGFLQTVLGAGDPIAYARVLGLITELGPVMIIDPYLKLEQLPDLLRLPNVTRIMSSTERKAKGMKATPFAAAMTMARHEVDVRLVEGQDLHDRYFIPDNGAVHMISTSMNGVGLRVSVITPSTFKQAPQSDRPTKPFGARRLRST